MGVALVKLLEKESLQVVKGTELSMIQAVGEGVLMEAGHWEEAVWLL